MQYDQPGQQIEVNFPMRADLNKRETVKGIAVGALKLRSRLLLSNPSLVDTAESPVMQDCGIYPGGDGSPGYTFDVLTAEDNEKYKHIKNFSGGFHQMLNFLQKLGLRFENTHLGALLHPFRNFLIAALSPRNK